MAALFTSGIILLETPYRGIAIMDLLMVAGMLYSNLPRQRICPTCMKKTRSLHCKDCGDQTSSVTFRKAKTVASKAAEKVKL